MIRLLLVAAAVLWFGNALAANYEPATMTLPAANILGADLLKGERYSIAESVTVEGYMNHYTVDSEYGQFSVVGDRALKKLLHEIDAIAELREMQAAGTGGKAVIGVVADTGKSVANLAIHPVQSVRGLSAGVSRFFKRNTRKAKKLGRKVTAKVRQTVKGDDNKALENAENEDPGVTRQLVSSFMGVSRARRELARELKVDPYSDNAILQAELKRVAQISGSVRKIGKFLMPIPSIVGFTANASNLVWSLSQTDLLIQNEEKLEALGYAKELSQTFFENQAFTPTEQTLFVAALESLDNGKGREILLNIAASAESKIESEFIVRSILLTQIYHENVEAVTEFISVPDGLVPAAITDTGDVVFITPLDHLLWTEEIASSLETLGKLIYEHGTPDETLMWVEGQVSDMAQAQLNTAGWVWSAERFPDLSSAETLIAVSRPGLGGEALVVLR